VKNFRGDADCSIINGGYTDQDDRGSSCSVAISGAPSVISEHVKCSAMYSPPPQGSTGGGGGHCSVIGEAEVRNPKPQCSLVPTEGPGPDPLCSVFSVGTPVPGSETAPVATCSISIPSPEGGTGGPGDGKAGCSVLTKTASQENKCSVFVNNIRAFCSVERGKGFCSVISFKDAHGIRVYSGTCTVMYPVGEGEEPEGACSVRDGDPPPEGANCSVKVINGDPIYESPSENGKCGWEASGGPGGSPPYFELPPDYLISNDPTPKTAGTCEPGYLVHVYIDNSHVGLVLSTDGTFEFEIPSPLSDGMHQIYGIGESPEGSLTEQSNTVHIIIDTIIGKPIITHPIDGSVITDNTPVIQGEGTDPGSIVEIYLDDNLIAITTAGAAGEFSALVTSALSDGEHAVYSAAKDEAGNNAVSDTVAFTVDTVVGTPLLDPIGVTGDSTPAISGSGTDPGASVAVVVDEELAGTTTADGGGNFSVTVADPLSEGIHTAYAVASDEAGNTATSETIEFTVGRRRKMKRGEREQR